MGAKPGRSSRAGAGTRVALTCAHSSEGWLSSVPSRPRTPCWDRSPQRCRRKVILHGRVLPEALPSPLWRRDGAIGAFYPMAVHSQSSTQLFKKKKKEKSGFIPFLQIQPHFSGAPGNRSLIPLWGSFGWDSFTSQTPCPAVFLSAQTFQDALPTLVHA